jgi:hypothetical protein
MADYSDEAYDDDMLFEFINDGTKDFSYTGCNQSVKNIVSGTISTLTLSSELDYTFLNIYAVEYASGELAFAPRHEAVRWNPSTATPTGWSVWGDTLYLDKTVTLSATNDIDISYTYIPNDITATTDTCPLDTKWIPALVAYCVYRCRESDREFGLADKAFAEYDAIKQSAAKIYEALLMGGGYSR